MCIHFNTLRNRCMPTFFFVTEKNNFTLGIIYISAENIAFV